METPTTPPQEESKDVIDTIFSDDTTAMENEQPTDEDEEEVPIDVLWKRIEESERQSAVLKSELELISSRLNSLKGVVKSHTTKIDTVEKTVRQNKEDANTEFNSIHTKHNQLEHSTDTRVAAVETTVTEQNKRLDEELAFVNRNYDKTSERLDELKISVTNIEDGTTVLPDKSPASDELKNSFKDAIVEAVTQLYPAVRQRRHRLVSALYWFDYTWSTTSSERQRCWHHRWNAVHRSRRYSRCLQLLHQCDERLDACYCDA